MGIELRRVFLYAVKMAQGAFAVFVEVFVLRFPLAEAHPPNVGYELLHVVCGGDVDAVELAQGAGIVHLGHAHESKVVQSLGLAIERGEHEGKTRFVTTRFGNVLGSNGSVIPRFREQIRKGGPVTVTHPDITRFFMTIPEACRLVMEAVILDTANRICVFDMGESVKIDTLARRMIELSGLTVDKDIKIEYTGLRPGEKLYEEVLSNVENTEPTKHGRIRIAKVRTYEYSEAKDAVEALNKLARAVEIPEMVKLMKQIVPEFISKNSKFSEYDAK